MESKVSKSGTVKIPFKSTPAYLHNDITSSDSYFCFASNNGDHLCTIFQINTEYSLFIYNFFKFLALCLTQRLMNIILKVKMVKK